MNERIIAFDDGAKTIEETWGSRGPNVLCIHGMTSSRRSWLRLGQTFEDRYRIVAYDQRGHGDAFAVTGPMTLAQNVADLRDVAAAIDGGVLALVGHSWGGAIAILGGLELAVRGVIAIDPVLFVPPGTWRRDYLDDAERVLTMAPAQREAWTREALRGWHPLDIESKLHAIARMTPEPIARLAADNDVEHGGWDLRKRIERYPKPLLVFAAGPEDSVMSAADVALLRDAGGPNVRVVEFPSEGHNLHRTAFDAFATEVAAFLAEL
jgi:pimeloyl-ACP methyl ester carboxylesterase